MLHWSPRQYQKKWTICLDYPGFPSGIELWLVTAAADSILWPTRVPAAACIQWFAASRVPICDFRVPAAGFQLQLSRVPAAGYKLRLTSSSGYSSSGSWIPVAADSFLRLTLVPAAGYELQLILSCGWLEFRRLDTSCSWLLPTVDSSSSDWVRVTADYILRLTRIPAARYDLELIHPAADYELWLILSWHWLEFRRLDSKCSWLIL